ncbi:MAG: 2-oxoacid:ferredoxin oxidoreductase subunit beta [Thermoplasmata archaeon]|nr:MAG: 2-oxoacid:ferredoxin oxidoreductase subunit beta [Thermoplasmata archaeon]
MKEHFTEIHLIDPFLRADRIPHIWCPGCGLGNVTTAFINAVEEANLNLKDVIVVSGIGCTGRIAGYLNMDSFHTTHGRAIPFATGLKLANPNLHVAVISGDGDIFAIGGNHFIHAARRNLDMLVLCVNNYIYGMTGGQVAPTTPLKGISTTSPYGNIEYPFNLPYLAAGSGATYVARWTSVDVRRLTSAIVEAFNRKGFSFIEVLAPCPTAYGRLNKMGDTVDVAKFFVDNTVIKHGADPKDVEIKEGEKIILGKFVDIEKETFLEGYQRMLKEGKK